MTRYGPGFRKRYFEYPNKYCYANLGLRSARLNFKQFDLAPVMENTIYNELLVKGYSVDTGVVRDRRNNRNVQKEIDFVVNSGDKRLCIQSAYDMNNEEKMVSEKDPLKLTRDFF